MSPSVNGETCAYTLMRCKSMVSGRVLLYIYDQPGVSQESVKLWDFFFFFSLIPLCTCLLSDSCVVFGVYIGVSLASRVQTALFVASRYLSVGNSGGFRG